jgi:hypothetical protein
VKPAAAKKLFEKSIKIPKGRDVKACGNAAGTSSLLKGNPERAT